ncbi:MAG: SDR family oxidoreductase [Clostridiales bacterium]|nr:SDR family oxidoreductase [Clostridiales bacterium]
MARQDGRVALVLGASAGLGRAVAEKLALEGARVAMGSRTMERVREAARAIEGKGGTVLPLQADVSRGEDIQKAVEAAVGQWGRLDILFFNSGGPRPGNFFDLSEEDWRQGEDLTLMGFVRSVRAAYPHLKKAATPEVPAHIGVIVSSSVKEGIDHLTLSNVYRPAIAALVKELARTLGPEHILVNAFAPGRFATQRVEELDKETARRRGISVEEARQVSVSRIPLGRYGDPSELARVAAFFLSPDNTYVTGQTIFVDGGLVRAL